MDVLIEDFKKFKLSPSLIVLLKTIHAKNNTYLVALNNVANVFTMAEWLQDKMILKITGTTLDCKSFEIRQLNIINYLNRESSDKQMERNIDEVINYFKKITLKSRVSNKSPSNRKFIKSRLQEYTVQDLKDVINLKYNQWKDDTMMRSYIRIETFMNDTKFQGYIGELESDDKTFSDVDLNTERA